MNTHLLRGDPKDVDKILADELNALSFHDREALSEEMHGVRSLAPVETPEMIQKALISLQFEFEGRLKVALVSLPSRNVPRNSNHIDNSRNNSRNNSNHNSSDAINSDCNSEDVSRRKYLNDLLKASEFFTSSSSCSSRVEGSRNYTKYSYALSDAFRLKFLRAELFDVKKAATRYLKCIDFLVAYFGLVALERPLYLKDLDKAEQKLMREGHCQLMPSRDRFGRRIVVFQGAVGKGYSHRNLVRDVSFVLHLLLIIFFRRIFNSNSGFRFYYFRHQQPRHENNSLRLSCTLSSRQHPMTRQRNATGWWRCILFSKLAQWRYIGGRTIKLKPTNSSRRFQYGIRHFIVFCPRD